MLEQGSSDSFDTPFDMLVSLRLMVCVRVFSSLSLATYCENKVNETTWQARERARTLKS